MSRKVKWLLGGLVGLILLGVVATALMWGDIWGPTAPLHDEIVLRLAEPMPPSHPSAMAAQHFADLVRECSDESIQIQVYYNGELGTDLETLDQTRFGGIAFARIDMVALAAEMPELEQHLQPDTHASPDRFMEHLHDSQGEIDAILEHEQEEIRHEFLIENLCSADEIVSVYSHVDRVVTLGCMPVKETVPIDKGMDVWKCFGTKFFMERRELGIFNIGGTGVITADGVKVALLDIAEEAAQAIREEGGEARPMCSTRKALARQGRPLWRRLARWISW